MPSSSCHLRPSSNTSEVQDHISKRCCSPLRIFTCLISVICIGQWHGLASQLSFGPIRTAVSKITSTQGAVNTFPSISRFKNDTKIDTQRLTHYLTAPSIYPNSSFNSSSNSFPISSGTLDGQERRHHRNGSEWCVLLDKPCAGNKSLAMDDLYETWEALIDAMHCVSNKTEENCNIRGNLGGLKYADAFETWMIGDKCMFTSSLWAQKQPPIAPVTHTEAFPMMHQQPPNGTSCCDECSFTVNGRVDIFYWPDPDADYSCLDIIGTEVKAIDDGATVDIWTYNLLNTVYSNTYWGCTARHPISGSSIIQTASLVTMGGYVFKQYLKDPWNPPDCIDMPQTMKAPGSASLIPENSVWHTVNTSGQQSSITRLQSHLGSTAVLDGITL